MHHHIDSLFALFKKLCSLNDDAYMSTMGVGSKNPHWSQTNDIHFEDHEFEVDKEGEGIVDVPWVAVASAPWVAWVASEVLWAV